MWHRDRMGDMSSQHVDGNADGVAASKQEHSTSDVVNDSVGKIVTVSSTWPSQTEADQAAHVLVRERLVACAQVQAPISSTYWWDGTVETANEYPLIVKTTVEGAHQVMARIQQLHAYVVPEILVHGVGHALPSYAAWVHDMVDLDAGAPQEPPTQ